jgi:hypothetical protein
MKIKLNNGKVFTINSMIFGQMYRQLPIWIQRGCIFEIENNDSKVCHMIIQYFFTSREWQ